MSRRDRLITWLCALLAHLFDFWRALRGRKSARTKRGGRNQNSQSLPRNIVVIKPCCLGDVALSSAAVADLRWTFPDARLTFAVGTWARIAVAHSPRLNAVIPWDTQPPMGQLAGIAQKVARRLRHYVTLVRTLRQGRYDCAVILDRSPLIGLFVALAGIPNRAGIDSLQRGFAHTLRVPLMAEVEHEADLYRRVVAALAKAYGHTDTEPASLEFYPSPQARQKAKDLLARLNPDNRPIVIVHPGGGINPVNAILAKRWPPDRFAAIVARLFESAKPLVLITGNAGDYDDMGRLAQELAHLRPDLRQTDVGEARADADIVSCHAAFDIDTLGAIFGHASLFLGNDTGLMHIATATGAAVVAVFGPSDPRMYGPYRPTCGGYVAPDIHIHWGKRIEEYRAMSAEAGGITAVTIEQVWAKVTECLPLKPR